ncbi:histidine phosphatase family protein [Marinomonas sp. 2405UD68-3]|uniref:histidine phosphatase family protein n=1 Tax=Marinomonas sp. 2405UD68-3 TaxID=3391835 RepID=UPI0039C8C9F0
MKLFLIRHPKPDVVPGMCYGKTDLSLPESWQEKANDVSLWLGVRLEGETVYQHSPLQRASLLGRYLNPNSISENELVELDFGEWEGVFWKDIPRAEIEDWSNNLQFGAPHKGESLDNVRQRLSHWWERQKLIKADNLVVVAHSGVIKVLVSMLCNWSLSESYRIDVGFCSVTELSVQGDYITLKRLGAGDWVAI